MLDRVLGIASALAFTAGTVVGPSGPPAIVELTFQDADIVEGSDLVAAGDGLFLTTNDSGDGGRVFVVDETGETVGTTSWAEEPFDLESLALAGPGEVWVGDTGDNRRVRSSITVLRVPFGRGDREVTPAAYDLVYPDGAHDAETLLAHPRTGRLYVYSKDVFGGTLYAAPRRLSTDRPNELRAVADGFPLATDGSFFPDGRHYVVRGYTRAAVYSYPDNERVGDYIPLPQQRQGEGISVGTAGELYLSTEGQFSELLRMRLPREIARAMEAPPATAAPEPAQVTGSSDDTAWAWLAVGAVVLLGFVAGIARLLSRHGAAS